VSEMSKKNETKTIVWGRSVNSIYVGELHAIEDLAALVEALNTVLYADSWAEISDEFTRREIEEQFSSQLDDLWESYREQEDLEEKSRPKDWFPDDHTFSKPSEYEVFWWAARLDHPDLLNLPDEFFDLGMSSGDMLIGDWHRWREEDLPRLREIAIDLGFQFVERQDLIERCGQ
jgi:hypothetical protein